MESTTSQVTQQEDEMSLKDLILLIQEWIKYMLKKWPIIIIGLLVGGGTGLTCSMLKKTTYNAALTFVLEEGKSNPLSSYSGLASQFGIDIGGSTNNGVFVGDNIIEFLKSRLMVEKTLLSPVKINEKIYSLADIYASTHGLKKKWSKSLPQKEIRFPLERSHFSLLQDSLLNIQYREIIDNHLSIAKPDNKLSFIYVECTSNNELFSKLFVERLVKEATDFYIQTKTKSFRATVDRLQLRADSIESLLNKKTYSAAALQDLNLNPARSVSGVNTELVIRDKMVLQTMYAEIVKNLEISRISMAQETPIIQVVDTPILPLKRDKISKAKGIILGSFLGVFAIMVWLMLIRAYKKIMAA